MNRIKRCSWVGENKLYIDYHDNEWGVPVYDDKILFEILSLEAAQAGLSWITILKKRDNYRKAFNNFDLQKIANYSQEDINRLLNNPGIIRNRRKIESVINNASKVIEIQNKHRSFSDFLWQFVGEKPIVNSWKNEKEIPTKTKESELMSKTLKERGFTFVGSTICYSFMQAVGMVNDHVIDCFCYKNKHFQ